MRRRARAISGALLALGAIAPLSGCGSSHASGSAADPATVVPASAPLYAGADVRPTGAEQAGAQTAARALTHRARPYEPLVAVLQTPGSPKLDYDTDVAPWLGPHAGVFLSSLHSAGALLPLLQQGLLGASSATAPLFPFAKGGAEGAIVLDTSDAAAARSFLEAQAKHAGAQAASYRGVSVQTGSGVSFALVQRLAVIGSEAAVHGVIDTTLGGAPLAASSSYVALAHVAPVGALAHVYANPTATGAGSQAGPAGLLDLLTGGRPANISLVASGSVAIDADTLGAGSGTGLASADPEAARAFGELPAESWLAAGLGNVGTHLAADVKALQLLSTLASSGGGPSPEVHSGVSLNIGSLLRSLLAPLEALGAHDAAARRDFQSWMGSAGIFASGGSLLELKGAVVIDSNDAALSRAAVAKLAARLRSGGGSVRSVRISGTEAAVGIALPGLPIVLDIAAGQDAAGHAKFVLGLGEASVTEALSPHGTMAQGGAAQTAAAAALGEGIQPSLYVDFPTVLSLAEGLGLAEDPTVSRFVPYLRHASTLAGGSGRLGSEVQRYRLVLGLAPASG